jgi:hypothetical protein
MKNAAITAAIFASAATMAHANANIRIDSSKSSAESKSYSKAVLERYDFSSLVDPNLEALSVALRLDDKPLNINVRTLMAAFEGADSTTLNIYNPNLNSCYGNCYTNCHGSRSWR